MDEKVKGYIEKNVQLFEPVFHVFDVEIGKFDNPELNDYQTVNDMDRSSHWHDNLTTQDFDDWEDLVKSVKKRVLK